MLAVDRARRARRRTVRLTPTEADAAAGGNGVNVATLSTAPVEKEKVTHGMGLLDRARVPGEARLDRRSSCRPRSSRSTSRSARTSSTTGRTRSTRRSSGRSRTQVKERGLWACHLGPDLGGLGYGQLKLGADERDPRPLELRRRWCSAARRPTPGNAEIIAHYGTDEQKEKYLQPLLDGDIVVLLLDDRAASRLRPAAVHVPRVSATATSGSSTARSGSRRTSATRRSRS